ncbi:MAG: hypothetical protein ABI315_08440 [Bacteroidia bacterium]
MNFFKKNSSSVLFICFILAISSCTKQKSKLAEYGSTVEKIMRSETGAFRGYNLGDQLDSVKAKETATPVEIDEGYLYYEYKIDDTTGSYSISYNFDETGLNEIQSDIFINNADNADKLYDSFKSYFDAHYGESEVNMGYNIWTVKSEKYGDVKINLSDESADLTVDKSPSKISIWIYPDKN